MIECNLAENVRMRWRESQVGQKHHNYLDALRFIRKMDAFWLQREFLACPRKVKQDFSDSIFIKAEIVPGLAFPKREVIITLLIGHIRRTQVTCRHYWSVGETHISPSEQIGFP